MKLPCASTPRSALANKDDHEDCQRDRSHHGPLNPQAPPGELPGWCLATSTAKPAMRPIHRPNSSFCWVDLATADLGAARSFYRNLFGWSAHDQRVGEGQFDHEFAHDRNPFASLYQLTRAQIEDGVASHWAPYVAVDDVQAAASRAADLGGKIVVPPQDIGGIASISLVADPTGALIGLWQQPREHGKLSTHNDP